MNCGALEAAVANGARTLGFVACGWAPAGPTPGHERFEAWLDDGCAADMTYLARHRALRADPRVFVPGARSVLVVAAPYPRNPAPKAGGIAMHARGADYHDIIRARLRSLATHLRRHGATLTRICVDTAPLAERSWALAAGIGWRGRQGQLITPHHGARVLLGAILTDLPPPGTPAPHPARCGSCRRCVEACPTAAIRSDGTVDARRCLSYWSIESRAPIPPDIAAHWVQTLFGCDRCTAVCPWNRFGEADAWPEFTGPDAPTVDEILTLDEAGFERRFARTALRRGGLARLRRNLSVGQASGNDYDRSQARTTGTGRPNHESTAEKVQGHPAD